MKVRLNFSNCSPSPQVATFLQNELTLYENDSLEDDDDDDDDVDYDDVDDDDLKKLINN